MPALERFLTSQGRRKFLRPLYEDLMTTAWGTAEAHRIYQRARPTYHAVVGHHARRHRRALTQFLPLLNGRACVGGGPR